MTIKKDFRESPHFAAFSNMADMEAFKQGVQSAFLAFVNQQTGRHDLKPGACFHRIQGANEFSDFLLRFHLKQEEPATRPDTGNLNHKI